MNLVMNTTLAQPKLTHLDLGKYSGKWYVIASIPTKFDKHWNYITESYHINENGTIEIYTTYKKEDTEIKSVFSKGFPKKESNNMSWKVQFIWPFKSDYLVEEITDDYTYVVVGHPKKKFLYIMNRSGIMGDIQYHEILTRCEQKGYNLAQLHKVEQGFEHH